MKLRYYPYPFLVLILLARPVFADLSFRDFADQLFESTWIELQRCGLKRWDAYDPGLPPPQVPALEAVVNSHGVILAYTDEEAGVDSYGLVFKAPNGGSRHPIYFSRDYFKASTPYEGTIARANRIMTIHDPMVKFYVGKYSHPADYDLWRQYLIINFRDVVVYQLCRFP